MNGVDKSDRDGRDNSVTIRTNRSYLQVWFWTIERVVHILYIAVCWSLENIGQERQDWKKYYTSKRNGKNQFQVDLGLLLMELGIHLDWKDISDPRNVPAALGKVLVVRALVIVDHVIVHRIQLLVHPQGSHLLKSKEGTQVENL
jgi:hypothetical protein